ncbi:MAG: hypothetical protein ACYDC1_06315 [Limisphaerales bacterium]
MKIPHAKVRDGKVIEVLDLDPATLALPPLAEPAELSARFGPPEIADLEQRLGESRPWGLKPDEVIPLATVYPPTPGAGQVVEQIGWRIIEGGAEPVFQLRVQTPEEVAPPAPAGSLGEVLAKLDELERRVDSTEQLRDRLAALAEQDPPVKGR